MQHFKCRQMSKNVLLWTSNDLFFMPRFDIWTCHIVKYFVTCAFLN